MTYKIVFFTLLVIVLIISGVFAPRIIKGLQLKQERNDVFAIQNVQTGRCLRPYNAGFHDDNHVILYDHHNWECITWHLIALGDETFLFENLYTEKTFEPDGEPKEGVNLHQRPLSDNALQRWELLKQASGEYLIRLKWTDLYLTAGADDQNSPVVLRHLQDSKSQFWRLLQQKPIV
jgi:hypothetical protein